MKRTIAIALLLWLPLRFGLGEDSFTAMRDFLQQRSKYSDIAESATVSRQAVKSALIHPRDRVHYLGKAVYDRPVLTNPQTYITDEGHFKIHYTLEGYHAVDADCTLSPNVPDWVYETARSAEYAYRLLIDTLGFESPPADYNKAGPELDIYIKNWAGSVYAYTYPEDAVSATERAYDYTSYLVIDNDYQESGYSTLGVDGLRVTVAHEFFHMVQLGYNWWPSNQLPGIYGNDGDRYFFEWCSTWMEERAYPQVDDYIQYMANLLYRPTKSLWVEHYWYSLGPFIRFLLDRYQDPRLLAAIWKKIKQQPAFESIREALAEYGGNLAGDYNQFMLRSYYTGARYADVFALSQDAADFPLLEIPEDNSGTLDNQIQIQIENAPFSSQPFLVTFQQNIFTRLENGEAENKNFYGSFIFDKSAAVNVHSVFSSRENVFIGPTYRDDQLILFITNASRDSTKAFELVVKAIEDTLDIESKILAIYPNPLDSNTEEQLFVEFRLGDMINEIELNLYDLLGRRTWSRSLDPYQYNLGLNTFFIPVAELNRYYFSSGIYLIDIRTDRSHITGKFTYLK